MTTLARLSPLLEDLLVRLVHAERSLPGEHKEGIYVLDLPGGQVCIVFAGLDQTLVESAATFEALVDLGYLEWRSAAKSLRPFGITLRGQAYVDQVETPRFHMPSQYPIA
jgi:hypothetical protein